MPWAEDGHAVGQLTGNVGDPHRERRRPSPGTSATLTGNVGEPLPCSTLPGCACFPGGTRIGIRGSGWPSCELRAPTWSCSRTSRTASAGPTGPSRSPAVPAALVSGRHLTWYGPSLAEAPAVLGRQLEQAIVR